MAFLQALGKLLNKGAQTVKQDVAQPVQHAAQGAVAVLTNQNVHGLPVTQPATQGHPAVVSLPLRQPLIPQAKAQAAPLGVNPNGINDVAISNPNTPLARLNIPQAAWQLRANSIQSSLPPNFNGALPPKMVNVQWSAHQVPYGSRPPAGYKPPGI